MANQLIPTPIVREFQNAERSKDSKAFIISKEYNINEVDLPKTSIAEIIKNNTPIPIKFREAIKISM